MTAEVPLASLLRCVRYTLVGLQRTNEPQPRIQVDRATLSLSLSTLSLHTASKASSHILLEMTHQQWQLMHG